MKLTRKHQEEYAAHQLWLSSHYIEGKRLDWSQAELSEVDLSGADLTEANLSKVNLIRADLSGANLSGANLSAAYLSGANLRWANLNGVNLSRGAILTATDLSAANLNGADLTGAQIGWTIFANVNLSTIKGLSLVSHKGPSSIGIDTLFRSKDIPDAFLRGTGVPDQLINYYKSLVGKAIEYYSCFISYSSKNEDFAVRLHSDLQNNNVRCWYAPEDMKIGDKLRSTIDQAIRVYEKLLLIMSESSVANQWVEQEVETALARERREKCLVLFPVRIDNTVMDTEEAWASLLRNTRNIGDFCQWKDHDAYLRSFKRLLRDLKAGAAT